MAVFALDQRPLLGQRLGFLAAAILDRVGHGAVHRAEKIDVCGVSALLVMDRAGWIALFDPLRALLEVDAIAGLIAHRPDDDGRVVFIAFEHVLDAVEVGRAPGWVLGQGFIAVAHAVGLEVGLIDDVEAEFVGQLVEMRVIRVVRAADRVDVGALHLQQVVPHVLGGEIVAGFRVEFVAVDPLEQDRLAVVQKLAVFHLVAPEAGLAGITGQRLARRIAQGDDVRIERGCLRRPRGDRAEGRSLPVDGGVAIGGKLRGQFLADQRRAVGLEDLQFHLGGGGGGSVVGQVCGECQRPLAAIGAEAGFEPVVAQLDGRRAPQVDVAENPGQPPHVLVLEVGAVAVLIDLDREGVLAVLEELGEIEFRRGARVL